MDTATAESYTYCHTLSLHDALPFSPRRSRRVEHPVVRTHPDTGRKCLYLGDHAERIIGLSLEESRRVIDELNGRRSEEHTSELQSLMRISSAVFCLTKQINSKK